MTNKERMLTGRLYCSDDPDLNYEFKSNKGSLEEFNSTSFRDGRRRGYIIKQMFKKTGTDIHIEPPFYCDYGYNISVGENFFASYDCILGDSAEIIIGNSCILGPRVTINTEDCPIDAGVRNDDLEYAKPVKIGNDVYIGAGSIINPGVTIGDDVVIGAGSVVTHDLASHAVYGGNPASKIRDIADKERKKWKDEQSEYYTDADVSQQES
jgi:maltose O-acetyltransferase